MTDMHDKSSRTEQATPKRLQEAREKGNILQSRDVNSTILLLSGACGLLFLIKPVAATLVHISHDVFTFHQHARLDSEIMFSALREYLVQLLGACTPFLIAILIAALVPSFLLGAPVFRPQLLAPKASRLSPVNGLKRMFGSKGLIELVKALVKLILVSVIAGFILSFYFISVANLDHYSIQTAIKKSLDIVGWSFLLLACSMVVIAVIDLPYQIYRYHTDLKMTKQEVKEEYKSLEGRPEVKRRIRQLQQQFARRRMMSAVPNADVVIVNPEHYAVALRYNQKEDPAPILLAKGIDHIAAHIIQLAKSNRVPIIQAPPLARAIYHHTKLNNFIPAGLFVAVAHVLAYVYQLRRYFSGQGPKPKDLSSELPIPSELQS